jgi:hypothetical protein
MDKYDVILLRIISRYVNEGALPRLSIQQLDWKFWSKVEDDLFGKIPVGEKLQKLTDAGFIARGYEPGAYSGYYITEKGKEYLNEE